MPRGIHLGIPFESRISPDLERASVRHVAWPCSFGLLATEHARRRHIRANYPDLASRFQPNAVGDDLDLSVDQMTWFFVFDDLFDDLFDGPRGRPDSAQALVIAVREVLDRPPAPDAEPVVRSFADLWRRSRDGMSSAWQARASGHWRAYLAGHIEEALARQQALPLPAGRYLQMRTHTIGAQPVLDLAERVGHFEIPEQIFASERMTRMRLLAIEIVVIQNDIWSVEKEEQAGDVNNLLLILEQSRSRAEAVETACNMIRARLVRFLAAEHSLPALCEGLLPETRRAVDRYVVDGLRALIRGSYDWSELSGRYEPVQQVHQPHGCENLSS
ncbi:hypothetical protein ACFFQW_38435 [Umezawaea endophytica]|uniref:Terpene synthase n=1 Tax=Umezawaea endophytica TaxID=1654476 RepID=A0A9X2VWS8_9PSEU|nr:hypothetical protein [Umezawaea endophytica]MCS7483822.1 hypothetical protein [Umezawaea endophytica]